jgi:hypothetical protein
MGLPALLAAGGSSLHRLARFPILALAAIALLLPVVSAHPRAEPFQAATSTHRCYVYTNDEAVPELWIESNGVVTGGTPQGTPLDHFLEGTPADGTPLNGEVYNGPGTGLQRASFTLNGVTYPPDTQYADQDADHAIVNWVNLCLGTGL